MPILCSSYFLVLAQSFMYIADMKWLHDVYATADFIKKVISVYTHSMETIYLSLSVQVAKSTFFMKCPVCRFTHYYRDKSP